MEVFEARNWWYKRKRNGDFVESSHTFKGKEEEEEEEKETLDKFGRRTSLSSANMISDTRRGSTNSLPVHTLLSPTKKKIETWNLFKFSSVVWEIWGEAWC